LSVVTWQERLQPYALYLAWLFSLVATLGSLYLSEVAGFVPCVLCWFQRIFMYPLAVMLGIAAYRGDESVAPYSLTLAGIGGSISIYHYLLQKVPALHDAAMCSGGVPCTDDPLNWLGFVTVPFLALIAFAAVVFFSWTVLRAAGRGGVAPTAGRKDGAARGQAR